MNGSALPLLSHIASNLDDEDAVRRFVEFCTDAGVGWVWINGLLDHAITSAVRARIVGAAADMVYNQTGPPWLPRGISIGLDNGHWGLSLPVEVTEGCCPPLIRTRVYHHIVTVALAKPELQPSGFLFPLPELVAAAEPLSVIIGATELLHLVARLWVFDPSRYAAA